MALALPTDRKGANIELNIVPFIDVMSCLTAFLLVAAAWIHVAQVPTTAQLRGAGSAARDEALLSILVDADGASISAKPSGESRRVAVGDWAGVAAALRALAPAGEHPSVLVAAESTAAHPVEYQALVTAMDTAVSAGFSDVRVTDPRALAP
jgi:biopolymer transport protein ExbD